MVFKTKNIQPLLVAAFLLLSPQEIQRIGEKVFRNECRNEDRCLIEWNEGEDFLSLGYGHFIWYPANKKGPFEESFIKLLAYLRTKDTKIPAWLDESPNPACPWNSREEFLRDAGNAKLRELRRFLAETRSEQFSFLVDQLEEFIPALPEKAKEQFQRVAATPAGMYALIDYINFKGTGILATERYQGKGWGLLQVLEAMTTQDSGPAALEEFVRAAKRVLSERVNNAPPQRNEKRWLAGWENRVDSYLKAF